MSRSPMNLARVAIILAAMAWPTPNAGAATEVEAALGQAVDAIRGGRAAQASEILEAAASQWSEDPRVFNLLGVVHAQQGRSAAAEEAFQRALELAPTFVGAHENLCRLYLSGIPTGFASTAQALAAHEAWLRADPSSEQARYETALLQTLEGLGGRALGTLDGLSPESRRRSMALAVRFAALADAGRLDEAAVAAKTLAAAPDFTEQDVTPLLARLAETAPGPTLSLLEGMVDSGNPSALTLFHLAKLQRAAGDQAAARGTLERAFQLDPRSAAPLIELAHLEFEQRDYKKTLGLLAHARDLDPENPHVHFFFGLTAVEMNLAVEAEESMTKAVELRPDAPYYRYSLGAILLTNGRPDQALEHFERFRSALPDDPRGDLSVGLAHYEAHRFEEAEPALAAAAKAPETAPGALYHLGRIALQTRQFDQAVERLRAAVDAQPAYAEALSELGVALLRVGDLEAADEAVHRAAELEPDSYRVHLNLLFYYRRTSDPRAEKQKQRFDEVAAERAQLAKELLRRVEARP